jgi:hypothetical protein
MQGGYGGWTADAHFARDPMDRQLLNNSFFAARLLVSCSHLSNRPVTFI